MRRLTGDPTAVKSLSSLGARERLAVALIASAVAVQGIVIALRRLTHGGDFDVSREFGRRLLAGEPLYAGGLHYPYMPTAALYFAPLAWLPAGVGLALRYAVALGCLWLTLRLLHAMVCAGRPALTTQGLALGALTVLFAAHYIVRDLDDGGPHVILLAMLVGAIYSVWRGRALSAALLFGLAAALKAPNALFLPFLLWKRQWRLAVLSTAALLAWTALPAVWMGCAPWWQAQREWASVAVASVAGHPADGAKTSEERVQNQALRPALARYCRPSPALVAAAADACRLPAVVMTALVALFAWWTRDPSVGPDDPSWLVQCSAVLILSALLSPVTWTQHLVVVIPALYAIAAAQRGGPGLGRVSSVAMAVYFALAVLLNREVLGRERYLALLAFGVHTLCMLIVLGVLARLAPETGRRAPAHRSS